MKKGLSVLLAAVMIFMLAACGNKQDTPSQDEQPNTPDENVEATADLEWLKGKDITIIVPFKAGGSLDLMVRAFVPYWEKTAGCTFIVENRSVRSILPACPTMR